MNDKFEESVGFAVESILASAATLRPQPSMRQCMAAAVMVGGAMGHAKADLGEAKRMVQSLAMQPSTPPAVRYLLLTVSTTMVDK